MEADATHSPGPNHLLDPESSLMQARLTPPLLKMPTEILGMILQDFAPPLDVGSDEFQPYWDCQVLDCSALLPVSQTCRRLREVVRTLPAVLKSVVVTQDSRMDAIQTQSSNKDISLNVYISFFSKTPPSIRAWYNQEVHRIQELHLTRLGHQSLDVWTPLLALPAPKLRFLSLASPPGVAWLPPRGVFLPLARKTSNLRYLTLTNVCFLPDNHFPSLTHLALFDIHVPQCDTNLMTILARCPALQSLVLCRVKESLQSKVLPNKTLNLPHLRRITLYDPVIARLAFYLASLPRNPRQALQIINFSEEPLLHKTLLDKYSPHAHTLVFTCQRDPRHSPNTYRLQNSTISLTSIGPDGVLHALLCGMRRYFSPRAMIRAMLSDKHALSHVREAWIVGVHPTKPIADSDNPDALIFHIGVSDSAFERQRLSSTIRDELVDVPSLESIVHVFYNTLEPNLYILPHIHDESFVSHKLKTLRIVIAHGLADASPSVPAPTTASSSPSSLVLVGAGMKRPEVMLAKLHECLATESYAYLDTLILQMSAHIVVDDMEIWKISKYVPTVKVERITSVPGPSIPDFCKEPVARGPWLGALW